MVCDVHSYEIPATSTSPIRQFYKGSNIFVTGATGFLGKVLIEKVLRSCPDVNRIYIIIREKKGRNMTQRVSDLVSSPCFDRLRREYPDFGSKLFAIYGDISLKGLGISNGDREQLNRRVDVVFHIAATVRFDEKLKSAILQNVRGTRDVLSMCQKMVNLKSVVYVSTAYANCPLEVIDECLYEAPLGYDEAIALAESLEETSLEALKSRLLGEWPNSYVFTKAIAEDAVNRFSKSLPIGIYRPAIVVWTHSEPMVGWVDNLYGPSGVIAVTATGLLRTMQVAVTYPANIVPCDLVVNALIAVAWDIADRRSSSEILPVYNFVSPDENAVTWHDFQTKTNASYCARPPSKSVWYPGLVTTTSRSVLWVYRLFLHFLPALLVDLCFLTSSNKPQICRTFRKVHKFTDVISYFSTKRWKFEDSHVLQLWKRLSPQDQDIFYFNMRTLNWDDFFLTSWEGMRTHLVHDNPESLPAARTRMRRLFWAHRFLQSMGVCVLTWATMKAFTFVGSNDLFTKSCMCSIRPMVSNLIYSTRNVCSEGIVVASELMNFSNK